MYRLRAPLHHGTASPWRSPVPVHRERLLDLPRPLRQARAGGSHFGSKPPYLPLRVRPDVVVFQTEPLQEDVEVVQDPWAGTSSLGLLLLQGPPTSTAKLTWYVTPQPWTTEPASYMNLARPGSSGTRSGTSSDAGRTCLRDEVRAAHHQHRPQPRLTIWNSWEHRIRRGAYPAGRTSPSST